jgi:hypothetical protein
LIEKEIRQKKPGTTGLFLFRRHVARPVAVCEISHVGIFTGIVLCYAAHRAYAARDDRFLVEADD